MRNSIKSALLGLAVSALVPAIAAAEIVEEKSGGNIEVQLFPGGMLGGDMQVVQSLQGGLVQMSTMNAGLLSLTA